MKEKKHAHYLWIIGGLILISIIGYGIDTNDMDEICAYNNALTKRINGTWTCVQTHYTEYTITQDTTITLPAHNTYYNITNMTQGHTFGITTNNNTYITIIKQGTYHIQLSTSFGGGGNTEYEMELFKNEVPINHCELHRKMGTGGDVGSASFTCIETFNINDNITIRVADNTNPSQNINIHQLNLNIKEII